MLGVRQPAEWENGVIPGSVLRFVAGLADPVDWLPRDRAICRSGHRAAMAARILAGAGCPIMTVDGGGVEDALRAA